MREDVERLRAKFASGALLAPSAEAPNLVDFARAIWSLAGVEGLAQTPASELIGRRIGASEHVLLVVVDGLGLELLEAMPAASFLWQSRAGELRTVFPSTTAVALTSLYTAEWPAEHAVTGHWMELPSIDWAVNVLPFTRRGDGHPLTERGVMPSDVFPLPSLLPRVPRETLVLLPAAIASSGFSQYAAGERPREGYRSLAEAVDSAIAWVQGAASATFTLLYVSRIDDAAHEHGPMRLEVVGGVRELDAQVARLAAALAGRARIVVTADHGHLAVPPGGRLVLRGGDPALAGLRGAPTGDARVAYFHVQPGALDDMVAGLRERLGERCFLLTTDEVEELRLFGPGPLSSETRARIGDLIAISAGGEVIDYRAPGGRPDRRIAMPSHHSGLSAAEMRVPLLLA